MNIETYYSIFDVCKPIMEANKEFKAENPQSAVKQYLKSIGENYTQIKASGSNDVRIKAEPFYIKDGTKYRHYKKRVVWYNII